MTMAIRHIAHPRRYPPRVTSFTQLFWEALAQGRFLVTRCARCDRLPARGGEKTKVL